MHNWHISEDFEQASKDAADFIEQQILSVLSQQAKCHIALPGGNTPARCLSLLAEKGLPWQQLVWYLGDERCLPEGHAERNDVMLKQQLWSRLESPEVHVIPAERGAEQAAQDYQRVIDAIAPLDIVFLGMGEDGHTASLFPDNPALSDTHSVVAVHNSPKPPPDRVSLGMTTLQNARVRVILASGEGKAGMISHIRNNTPEAVALPVNSVGAIHWFIDKTCLG